jgi:DNA-binding FadR family transcriptional regulator
MQDTLEPLKIQSLKDACIARLEGLILSGELKIGERLPSERDFAARLGVSRPVLHEALVDLDAKGLVEIVPRRGVFVSDYLTKGSLTLLTALLAYSDGELSEPFLRSLLDMRMLMETETARLAALHHTPERMQTLHGILDQEIGVDRHDEVQLSELDFTFHQSVAQASGNLMYLLVINSLRPMYTNITRRFFSKYPGNGVLEQVFSFHRQLTEAIQAGDSQAAAQVMADMLRHGAEHL